MEGSHAKTSHIFVLAQPSGFWNTGFLNHVNMMKNLPLGSCATQTLENIPFVNGAFTTF